MGRRLYTTDGGGRALSAEPAEIVREYLRGERDLDDPAVSDALDAFTEEPDRRFNEAKADLLAWRWQNGNPPP